MELACGHWILLPALSEIALQHELYAAGNTRDRSWMLMSKKHADAQAADWLTRLLTLLVMVSQGLLEFEDLPMRACDLAPAELAELLPSCPLCSLPAALMPLMGPQTVLGAACYHSHAVPGHHLHGNVESFDWPAMIRPACSVRRPNQASVIAELVI